MPAKRGNSTRVEVRSPDPAANPYLAFAALLLAGLDGVKNRIEPPASVAANIYKLSPVERLDQNILSLPGSLYEALEEMKTSTVAKEALGEHIYGEFIKAKEVEWDEYRTDVTPWELERYMPRY